MPGVWVCFWFFIPFCGLPAGHHPGAAPVGPGHVHLPVLQPQLFGGGIGRMRQTCGAACGLFLVAGLETGCTEGHNPQGKEANYKVVQELAEEFRKRNGSLICAELLGLAKNAPTPTTPDARNGEYYKKRPCVKRVEEAARIWCEYLKNNKKEQ